MTKNERYSEKENRRPTAEEQPTEPQCFSQNNVKYMDTCRPDAMKYIRRYTVVNVRALSYIPAGAQLFVHYGRGYIGFDN